MATHRDLEYRGRHTGSQTFRCPQGRYSYLRLDVLDGNGRRTIEPSVRVEWTGGWTLLLPMQRGEYSASMPLTVPGDVYVLSIAGEGGQELQARGAEGYDLVVTFRRQ